MTTNVVGEHALFVASILAPHCEIRSASLGGATITLEEAQAAIDKGEGGTVFVPIPDARLLAILDRFAEFKDAVDNVNAASQQLEERIISDRAQFVRKAATQFLAAEVGREGVIDGSFEAACKGAVNLAEHLDKEIWSRVEVPE